MPAGVSAYVPLANVTLGTTALSVTFSSISQSYRDLVLVAFSATTSESNFWIQINGDTGNNYSAVNMVGDGSSTYSQNLSTGTYNYFDVAGGLGDAAGQTFIINFMDYSATDKHKTVLWRNGKGSAGAQAEVGRWANTSAITSILIDQYLVRVFGAGSTFALYGVSA
jgi:hypothetical protein